MLRGARNRRAGNSEIHFGCFVRRGGAVNGLVGLVLLVLVGHSATRLRMRKWRGACDRRLQVNGWLQAWCSCEDAASGRHDVTPHLLARILPSAEQALLPAPCRTVELGSRHAHRRDVHRGPSKHQQHFRAVQTTKLHSSPFPSSILFSPRSLQRSAYGVVASSSSC